MLAVGRHGLVATFGDHLMKADQHDTFCLQSGQLALKHLQRLRVGVADQDG
ncbi:hypothetical protein D3C79_1054260 [compost metagenome]